MRVLVRSLSVVVLALASTISLAVAWTTATAVQLLASALFMGGTDHPLSSPPDDPASYITPYMSNAVDGYINPAAAAGTGTTGTGIVSIGVDDTRYAVVYPAQFFPIFGSTTFDDSVANGVLNANGCVRGADCSYNDLSGNPPVLLPIPDDEFSIFGYSQSAVVASLLKRDLIENPQDAPAIAHFFLLANPMRPNGGILARGLEGMTIPILGITFYGASPTNSCEVTCYATVDVAAQYDLLGGDAPASLTNVLAWLNAAAGYYYLHGDLQYGNLDDALYQGAEGDTDYYIVPARRLPILMPLEPIIPSPLLTLLDAPLRAAIEGAYARDVNPGIATGMGLLPFRDPIRTLLNIIKAIPTGIDDALAEAAGDPAFRPLGTAPVESPFGVGGPVLPPGPPQADASQMSAVRSQSDPVANSGAAPEPDDSDTSTEESREPLDDDELDEDDDELGEDEETDDGGAEGQDGAIADGDEAAANPPVTATNPELPEVRGPIEFDSQQQDPPETTDAAPGSGWDGEPAKNEPATNEPNSNEPNTDDGAAA